jgi:hypothetical protein
MTLRISLFVIAALLMGAHFLRGGNYLLTGLCLTAPLGFLYRKRWSLILLQLLAYAATAVWTGVALELLASRQQMGRPWAAASVILGAVALLTLVAGLLMNSRCLRQRYA